MKKILLGIAIFVAVFAAVGFMLPERVHVERSTDINAPADKVFALVNNFREFNKWSPWAKLDPDTQYTFTGPDSGVGAMMSWQSAHANVGSGSQKIVESEPNKHVSVTLNFSDQGVATATYDLTSQDLITRITWGFSMDLGANPIARYFGLFFDGMIGSDYERGLATLKTLAETQ